MQLTALPGLAESGSLSARVAKRPSLRKRRHPGSQGVWPIIPLDDLDINEEDEDGDEDGEDVSLVLTFRSAIDMSSGANLM